MLECDRLLVCGTGETRQIVNARTGDHVGTVRRVVPAARWLLGNCGIEVVETGDAPLLFTVGGGWFANQRRLIRDAEGRLIGRWNGSRILDQFGRTFAQCDIDGSFISARGHELGRLWNRKSDLEVAFAEAIRSEPFAKMLILAAALQC
jgi:hypothetical protein